MVERILVVAFTVTAVCCMSWCHAADLTDADLAKGTLPAVGDTVMLTDFASCFPHSAITTASEKGKWWLRPYTVNGEAGAMLCVEERDQENPATCIAPVLTYPIDLEGVYDISVGTYRPVYGGGIDIKLTRDKFYYTVTPREDGVKGWPPAEEKVGRLIECFYTTADLTGQGIHLRLPYGTYDSYWWGMCNAHVAYIKLVRRDPEDVARESAERRALPRKGVIVDRDGFSWVWQRGVPDVDCILQQVEYFQFDNVQAFNWCIGGSLGTNFPHPMTTGRIGTGARLGDKRAHKVFKDFEDRGIDILHLLVDRCHELGIKFYASHRANVHYHKNNVWDEHPEWQLESRRGLNYANPEARGFYRDYLLYVAENYDIDGLTIDFSRHRQHFNPGQENQFEHMNTYLRELRAGLDRIGAERGKHLVLNASFTCGTWYDGQTAAAQGLDVETWVQEGFVGCIMPEGRAVRQYIDLCKGKKTLCYPRKCASMDFDGTAMQSNTHDPTPEEDKQDQPLLAHMTPLEIAEGVLNWYDSGADGVFLFNYESFVTLRNLPYASLVRGEVQSGHPFGWRVVGKVEWNEAAAGDV
ncbi:MAG: hypothetical protein GY851_30065 [bacterium]|nr:hypothetical protein [bacterium]